MKMNLELIKAYLRPLVNAGVASGPNPLADLKGFDGGIEEMRRRAAADDNLEWLRLSIDALVANPKGRIQKFAGFHPMTDAELVSVLRYAHSQIWPDRTLSEPGSEVDLQFVTMSDEEWDLIRNSEFEFDLESDSDGN